MMRKILAIAWNDVQITFSYPVTLIFFLVLPLVFTAIIGAGLSTMDEPVDPDADTRFAVLVADQDGTKLSAELIAVLETSEVIRLERVTPEEADRMFAEQEETDQLFAEQEAVALLIIPAGFADTLLAGQLTDLGLRELPDDNRVLAVEQATSAAASQLGSAVAIALASVAEAEGIRPFADDAARQVYFEQGLAMALESLRDPPVSVEATRAPEISLQVASGFEQSSAGQLVSWVLITLLGSSAVFVDERVGGTLRRLLTTPTGKATMLLGKIVGQLGMGILQMALLIGAGAWFFGVDWGRSPAALVLVMLSFGLAAVALGVLMSTFIKTSRQANSLTILFSMVMAALGGAWWSLEVTPPLYQSVVRVLPSTWAMMGFTDVIVRGQDVIGVLPEVGVLMGFALVFFVAGVWRFKYE